MALRIRSAGRFTIYLVILCVFGIALTFTAHACPLLEKSSFGEGLGAAGDAAFIAGALGLTVDKFIKKRLVKDVAATVVTYLWGVNAPQEYIEKLRDSLSEVKNVGIDVEWELELSWNDHPRVLKVRSTLRMLSQNISDEDWMPGPPWLTHSIHPKANMSVFESYVAAVRQPSSVRRAPVVKRANWTAQELKAAGESRNDGGVGFSNEFIRAKGLPNVQPGGTFDIHAVGATYQPVPGGIPLVSKSPCLAGSLTISGNAWRALNIQCYLGSKEIALASNGDSTSLEYGFSHAEATLRVEWSLREIGSASSLRGKDSGD